VFMKMNLFDALGDGNIGVSVVRNGNLRFVDTIANKLE